jgi:ABC-2 type transport system permease protein
MGIREQGYRHWQGRHTPHATRWWTVAKQAMRTTTHSKLRLFGLLAFVFLVWAPYFFYGLTWFIVGAAGAGGFRFGAVDSDRLLRDNLYDLVRGWQILVFIGMVATPFVSNDLRSNALYIYLAKPLRRWDYVLGKLTAVFLLAMPVTVLPNLFVVIMAWGSTDKESQLRHAWEILGEVIVVQATFIVVLGLLALAASSLTKRWWVGFGGLAGAYFILHIVSNLLQDILNKRDWILGSISTNLINWAKTVFERPAGPPSWEVSLAILVGLSVLSFGLFLWRILTVEVAE